MFRVIPGHRKGFRANPGKDMGLMGQVREHTYRASHVGRKEKERRKRKV